MKIRDDIPDEIAYAAQQAFRGYTTSCTVQQDDSGNYLIKTDAVGRHGETLNTVPVVFPYGFASRVPVNTELVFLETDGGLVAVAERHAHPTLQNSQVILYDKNGALIKLTADTGATRRVEIGKGGSVKDAARKDDLVTSSATFNSWAADVEALLAGLGAVVGVPWAPGNQIGTISTGSTTVGIED